MKTMGRQRCRKRKASSRESGVTALGHCVPILPARDVDATAGFYVRCLGFTITQKITLEGGTAWAQVRHGRIRLMFNRAKPSYKPGADSATYYYYPPNVSALRQAIKRKKHPVSDLAITFYAMREFKTVDPDGRKLCFGQPCDKPMTGNNEATERWVEKEQRRIARQTRT